MKQKRGQFYFIAAMIIILIIVGFVTIANVSSSTEDNELRDIQSKLNIETEYLFDYFSNNQLTQLEIDDTCKDFTENYIENIGIKKTTIFLFGAKGDSFFVKGHRPSDEEIIIYGSPPIIISESDFEQSISGDIDDLKITYEGTNYSLDFNFFIL